jgi:hypothetical protein
LQKDAFDEEEKEHIKLDPPPELFARNKFLLISRLRVTLAADRSPNLFIDIF